MALDADLIIDDSVTIDISASATPAIGAGLILGRRGFPQGATFVVVIEEASDDDSIDPVKFNLLVSPDGGTTKHRVATIDISGNDSLLGPRKIFSVPIGLMDFRQEVEATPTDLRVYTEVILATTGSTDDFTYSSYLAGPNPYPHFLPMN